MAAHQSRWRARALATCVIACVFGGLAGCSSGGSLPTRAPTDTQASTPVSVTSPAKPTAKPTATPPGPRATTGSPTVACATQVYGSLSLAQRVGQLFLVGVSDDTVGPQITAAEQQYHFGSFLLGSSGAGTTALAYQTGLLQAFASETNGVRFFIAANQEGGEVQQLTGPGFEVMPSALVQGTWSTSQLRSSAEIWGSELHAAGVNLNLAPVMDVVPDGTQAENAPIGALDREFGFTPQNNGTHGVAFIAGMAAAGVTSVAKHFPGLGRVTANTDFSANVVDTVTTPNDPFLGSFRTAIKAGVPFVMVAEATYTQIDPDNLAVFSPTVMRLLRASFGFNGVIVSDDLGQAVAVQSIPAGTRAIDFLQAGGDLITSQILPPAEQMASAVLARAQSDPAFAAIVDAAVQRVLAAKQAAGLLPC